MGGGGYFKAPLMSCFVYTPSLEVRQTRCLPSRGAQVQPRGWAEAGVGLGLGEWACPSYSHVGTLASEAQQQRSSSIRAEARD